MSLKPNHDPEKSEFHTNISLICASAIARMPRAGGSSASSTSPCSNVICDIWGLRKTTPTT